MTASRQFPLSGTGPAYMAKIAEEGTALYNAAALPLTNVAGGTANNPKTTCFPALTAGLVNGMSFWWQAVADNGGPMTMVVDGLPAVSMLDDSAQPLGAGVIKASRLYKLLVWAGSLVVMNTATILKVNDFQRLTASGTWNKPVGTPANAKVTAWGWAGGGGGGAGTSGAVSGGSGGGCIFWEGLAGDLPASVSATIGAGGAVGVAGGTTSFGSLFSVGGGGSGASQLSGFNKGAGGGGGGGAFGAGGNGAANSNSGGSAMTVAGGSSSDPTAGGGGSGSLSAANAPSAAAGSNGWFGGGGGGGCATGSNDSTSAGGNGGRSVYGGGGGAGRTASTGGVSQFGGNGGAPGAAGAAPGGGGGSNAAGARGEIRVYVNG